MSAENNKVLSEGQIIVNGLMSNSSEYYRCKTIKDKVAVIVSYAEKAQGIEPMSDTDILNILMFLEDEPTYDDNALLKEFEEL